MATAIEAQPIITEARCLECNIPPGYIWYAVLAALIDLKNGDPVPTSPDEIIDEARCLFSCVPAGYVPYAILAAIQDISSGGGLGAAEVFEDRDPLPPDDPTKAALSYNSTTGILSNWSIAGQAWI